MFGIQVMGMTQKRQGLISAKLRTPAPRRNCIYRAGLADRLESLIEVKVTVVKGAAGSGKTTLLTSYLKERGLTQVRWISLDQNDNDVLSLWSYLLAALAPDLGEQAADLRRLLESIMHAHEMETVLVAVVNALDPEEDVLLVLDDAHQLTDQAVLRSLDFFLRYSSERVHLVLLTRTEPELYLGDLRMAGQLLEFDESDLKVSPEEGQAFLKHTLGLELDAEATARMNELAEGWIGGLQLLAIAMGQKKEQVGFIPSLNKHMVDYLSNEILRSLADQEQEFLVCTSILSYFDAAICGDVLGNPEAGTLLRRLAEKNLFLIAVDEERGVYRYHHLFGEFLRLKFMERPEAERRGLHKRAAHLYLLTGDLEESVNHCLLAGEYAEALRLIGRMGGGVKGWSLLKRVPLAALHGQPEFIYQRLFSHFGSLELDECNRIISYFKERLGDPLSDRLFNVINHVAGDQPYDLRQEDWSPEVMKRLELGDETRAVLYLTVSMVLSMKDQAREALVCINEADLIEQRVGNPYIRYFLLILKGQIKEYLGDIRECEAIYDETFRLVERNAFLVPTLANGYIGIVGILLKTGRLAEAESYLERARSQGALHPSVERGYRYNLMELYVLRGEQEEAARAAEHLMQDAVFRNPLYSASVLKYLLLLDRADDAVLRRFQFDQIPAPRWEDYLLQARLLLRAGRHTEALAMLDQQLGHQRRQQARLPLVEALLLKVQVLEAAGGAARRDLRNALREAVHYSYENRLMAPFLLGRERIATHLRLLREDREADLCDAEKLFLDGLMSAWGEQAGVSPVRPANRSLLSERECEVLQVLAEGATNKEIADRLHISLATVKTPIINIYSKLQVSNRVEVVAKAAGAAAAATAPACYRQWLSFAPAGARSGPPASPANRLPDT